eukprot:TRINITY_DN3806_c0_g1_i3.p1 TRINITY_DN3806_c0_g1~~TRINITY_DN3806_c0_g1_i3.p1  ORF type:complete len:669 (-),score=95.69 TRINITY_DN3806_c0_g1_i3:27-2033(-)
MRVMLKHRTRAKGLVNITSQDLVRVTKGRGKAITITLECSAPFSKESLRTFLMDGQTKITDKGIKMGKWGPLQQISTSSYSMTGKITLTWLSKNPIRIGVDMTLVNGMCIPAYSLEFYAHDNGKLITQLQSTTSKFELSPIPISPEIASPNTTTWEPVQGNKEGFGIPDSSPAKDKEALDNNNQKKRKREPQKRRQPGPIAMDVIEESSSSYSDTNPDQHKYNSGNVGMEINGDLVVGGKVVARGYQQYSDLRLKTNVEDIVDAVSLISKLRAKRYRWKVQPDGESIADLRTLEDTGEVEATSKRVIGLIAQEVQQVLPEVVQTDEDGYLSVAYTEIVPVLVQAFNEHLEEYNEDQKLLNEKFHSFRQSCDQEIAGTVESCKSLAQQMKELLPNSPYSRLVKSLRRQRRRDFVRRQRDYCLFCLAAAAILFIVIFFAILFPTTFYYSTADCSGDTVYNSTANVVPLALRSYAAREIAGGAEITAVHSAISKPAIEKFHSRVLQLEEDKYGVLVTTFYAEGELFTPAAIYEQALSRIAFSMHIAIPDAKDLMFDIIGNSLNVTNPTFSLTATAASGSGLSQNTSFAGIQLSHTFVEDKEGDVQIVYTIDPLDLQPRVSTFDGLTLLLETVGPGPNVTYTIDFPVTATYTTSSKPEFTICLLYTSDAADE